MTTNDATQAERRTGGFCSWHRLYSRTAVPVRAEGSGPASRTLSACLACRRDYGLIPLSEQPQ